MNKNNEFEFEELKDKGSTLSVHTGDPLAIREMQKELNKWGYTDGRGKKLFKRKQLVVCFNFGRK